MIKMPLYMIVTTGVLLFILLLAATSASAPEFALITFGCLVFWLSVYGMGKLGE